MCAYQKGGSVYLETCFKVVSCLCLCCRCMLDVWKFLGGKRGGQHNFFIYNFRHQMTKPMERGTTCGNGTCGTRVHLGDQREMWTRATTKQNRDQQEKSRRPPINRILQTRNPKDLRPYMDLRSTSPEIHLKRLTDGTK